MTQKNTIFWPIFLAGPMVPIHPVWANGPLFTRFGPRGSVVVVVGLGLTSPHFPWWSIGHPLMLSTLAVETVPIAPPRVDSSKGPHWVNRDHWPTKENWQQIDIFFGVMNYFFGPLGNLFWSHGQFFGPLGIFCQE